MDGGESRTPGSRPSALPRRECAAGTRRPVASPPPPGWSAALTGRRRLVANAGEALVAVAAAALSVQLSRGIEVDPLDRVGQVSGLAALDLRFTLLGLVVVAAMLAATRVRGAVAVDPATRLGCAAVAGLATGLVGGGIVVALRGSSWPLFANWGDSGQLIAWASDLGSLPANYPPAMIYAMAAVSWVTGDVPSALQAIQIVGTAVFGPIAYLAWRLVLPPMWALGIGLVPALPLLDPYKPYTNVVLVVLLPVLVLLLRALRDAAALSWGRILGAGLSLGAAAGALFLVYSGWFVWSAPGVVVAALALFPWRSAPKRGLALLGSAAAAFAAVSAPHLVGLLRASASAQDRYFYFDVYVDPAYVAMWRGDLPGQPGPWPPPGELAGVGVFTLVLVVGLGVAIALGGRRTTVLTIACCMAGAWVVRFWFASQMYADAAVQLWPRTTPEILYCLLLLTGFAAYLVVERARGLLGSPAPDGRGATNGSRGVDGRGRRRIAVPVGVVGAVLLLALSAGSAVADRYMPRDDDSVGLLAYVAQMVRQPDGTCPAYSAPDDCAPTARALLEQPETVP